MKPDFDIAIVGGGMVGATLASALSGHGYRIAVIEVAPPRLGNSPSYDDRTLVLAYGSQQYLNHLGVWPQLQERATAVLDIMVSQRLHFGRVRLSAAQANVPALGYVVEARQLGTALYERLDSLDDVTMISPARVSAVTAEKEHRLLTLSENDGPSAISCRLLVGCDGTHSMIREALQLPVITKDYRQTAIIANVTPEKNHQNQAFERLTDTGPVAILPHVGSRVGIVWCVPSAEAEAVLQWPEQDFLQALHRRCHYPLGRFHSLGRRTSYPLKQVVAHRQTAHRGVVIGNAAHTIHPVSAQGFNLGLRDAARLAHAIRTDQSPNKDPGNAQVLHRYTQSSYPDQSSIVRYTDDLIRVFAHPSPLMAAGRTLAMLGINQVSALRGTLVNKRLGLLTQEQPTTAGL